MNLATAYEQVVRRTKQCSQETSRADRRAIAVFGELVPGFRRKNIRKINSKVFAEFRSRWIESGGSPATGNKHMAKVRSCLRVLAELGEIPCVPVFRRIPELAPRPRAASDADLDKILAACEAALWPSVCCSGCYWKAVVLTGVNLGLRKQDIFSVKWSDLEPDGTLTIRMSKDRSGKLISLPVTPGVLAAWEKIRTGKDLIFYSTKSKKQFYREWHRIQDKAGIPKHYSIHDLRKTFANRVAEVSGATAASELLGHSSLQVTMKHYLLEKIKTGHLRSAVTQAGHGEKLGASQGEELLLDKFRSMSAENKQLLLKVALSVG